MERITLSDSLFLLNVMKHLHHRAAKNQECQPFHYLIPSDILGKYRTSHIGELGEKGRDPAVTLQHLGFEHLTRVNGQAWRRRSPLVFTQAAASLWLAR